MGESAAIDSFLKFIESETCHPVTMATRIEELNLDSLEFIELVQEISAKFGPVPDEKIARVCTVEELWNAIPS